MNVRVVAPDVDVKTEFTDIIRVQNLDDPDDYCDIRTKIVVEPEEDKVSKISFYPMTKLDRYPNLAKILTIFERIAVLLNQ